MAEVLRRLRDYFQSIANDIDSEKAKTNIFPNKSDSGGERENIIKAVLEKHLPARCKVVKGGFIFDLEGNESKQVDLIITNDLTLQFKIKDKSFNCIEGCYAALSIKSHLDKQQLLEALDNIGSIPRLDDDSYKRVAPYIENRQDSLRLPYKAIFSFDGISPQKIMEHMIDYCRNNQITDNNLPAIIIVNNKYFMSKLRQPLDNRDLIIKNPEQLYLTMPTNPYVGAMSLSMMLTQIQRAANLGSHMKVDFTDYAERMILSS